MTLEGSENAFATLFKRYYPELLSYALKVSAQQSQAEDAIQDIFVNLWMNRNKLSDMRFVRGYLFVATRRKIIRVKNAGKKRLLREKEYSRDDIDFQLSHEEFLISADLEKEQQAIFSRLLSELSSRQREIIYLRFYDSLSYEEIAQVLDIRNQTARNHVSDALQVLRRNFLSILPGTILLLDLLNTPRF